MFLFIAAGVRLLDAGYQDTQEISPGRGLQLRIVAGFCITFGCFMIFPTVARMFVMCDGSPMSQPIIHVSNVLYCFLGIVLIGSGSIYIKWSNQHNGKVNKNADRTLGTMFIMVGITILLQVVAYIYKNRSSIEGVHVELIFGMLLLAVLFAALYYGTQR